MKDKIKKWIANKLNIPEDSEVNILNVSMDGYDYLVIFKCGNGMSTMRIPVVNILSCLQ